MKTVTFNTAGDGYWSDVAKAVNVVDIRINYCNEEKDFGELCIYFDDSWNVKQDGLIYTDKQFMAEVREFLTAHGLPGSDVDYSEQGMQEVDYVSCDVGADFIAAWERKFPSNLEVITG